MKNKMLLLAMFVLPLTVQAGGSELHGGDSVVCFQTPAQKQQVEKTLRQNKVASQMGYIRQDPFDGIDLNTVTVETLDIWETNLTSTSPRKFVDFKNVDDGLKDRLAVLMTKSAAMANQIQNALDGFYAPSKWLASPTGVVEIDDSRELINYTKLCIPVQIAVQTNTRVYYDGRLFSRMNATNKVALILHEALYSWLKQYSGNSLNVRKYVGMMMLEDFSAYPWRAFLEEFIVDYSKVNVQSRVACPSKTIIEGIEISLTAAWTGLNTEICKEFRIYSHVTFSNRKEAMQLLSQKLGFNVIDAYFENIRFSNDGYIILDGSVQLKGDEQYLVTEVATPFKIISEFSNIPVIDGRVVVGGLTNRASAVEILGQEIEVYTHQTSGDLEYKTTPSGVSYLSSFKLGADYTLKAARGFKKVKECKKGSYVNLNPEGLVVSCNG